jgi:hypothetical protein
MNRWQLTAIGACGFVAMLAWEYAASQSTARPTTLAGARHAIEAVNYPSLQEAIDALPASGGVVQLPPGTIEIDQPLRITQEDVMIEGSGTATHIKNNNVSGQPAILLESPQLKNNARATLWRIQLENLRITGNEKSGHGIWARRINEIYLHGVTVSYHGGDGIFLDFCTEDPRVCDCLISYNKGTGLHVAGCHDIVVVGNHFEENRDAVYCHDGFNLCMTGNNIDDHLRHGVVIENTYGSVVSGNMIEQCQGTGIVLERDCYGITLSSNVLAMEHQGGIDLRDAHGCAVSANSFTRVAKDALRIGPASGRITVTGNNFAGSYLGEGKFRLPENNRAASGIVLSGTTDITITGNSFSSLTTKALTLEGEPSKRVLFTGNVLTDAPSDHAKLDRPGENLE